jgi:hypothetical protein
MNTAEGIWPTNRAPGKDQITRMYRLAYMIDPGVFTREDVVDFGLDLHRLKECGEVRMSKPLPTLRKHVPGLWSRMDQHQRGAFILSYLLGSLETVSSLVKDLQAEMGELNDVNESLVWMNSFLLGKFPKALQERLRKGRERWGSSEA